MQGKILGCIFLVLATAGAKAQRNDAVVLYINTYKELAMQEMQRTGVPAAIKLAQGIHETEAGNSELVRKSNNHFGLKCKASWTGDRVYHDDDARGECFRSYGRAEDSYRDQSDFLKSSPRYAGLFQLDPSDYKSWAWGLKKAGYATNNAYPQILIKYIEDYNLQQYSLIAMGKMKAEDEVLLAGRPPVNVPNNSAVSIGTAITDTRPIAPQATADNPPPPPHPDYPKEEFEINKTRVVFVPAGTALLAEAEHFRISYSRLLEFNDLKDGDILQKDQLIYLQRKRKTGANDLHVVVPGETVYDICQSEGLRLESLLEYNQLSPGMQPAPGETLYLRSNAPARPALRAAYSQSPAPARPLRQAQGDSPAAADSAKLTINGPAYSSDTTHIVRPKETLYSISKKYGVSLEQLKAWNNLDTLGLKTGQQLVIHKN